MDRRRKSFVYTCEEVGTMRRWRVEVTARGGNLTKHEVDCDHAWQAVLDAGRAGILPKGEHTVVVVDVVADNQRAIMAAGYC